MFSFIYKPILHPLSQTIVVVKISNRVVFITVYARDGNIWILLNFVRVVSKHEACFG